MAVRRTGHRRELYRYETAMCIAIDRRDWQKSLDHSTTAGRLLRGYGKLLGRFKGREHVTARTQRHERGRNAQRATDEPSCACLVPEVGRAHDLSVQARGFSSCDLKLSIAA